MTPPGTSRDPGEIAQGAPSSKPDEHPDPNNRRMSRSKDTAAADDERRAVTESERPIMPTTGDPLPYDDAPPLPEEAPPEDDGWDALWDGNTNRWYFRNRFTGVSQWENPRVPESSSISNGSYDRYAAPGTGPDHVQATSSGAPGTSSPPKKPLHGGYNPAIHGNYDPNADYAKAAEDSEDDDVALSTTTTALPNAQDTGYVTTAQFNRFTGRFQPAGQNPEYHNDENKSLRQQNNFFDVDAAANSHEGRSLKEERRKKTLTRKQLKEYKDKHRKKKEEKRRAWLLD